MIDAKLIDDIAQKLAAALPPGVQQLQQDIERNVRAVLQDAFARMDLVTREEFDIQRKVLLRTREKLESLEKQLTALEDKLGKSE